MVDRIPKAVTGSVKNSWRPIDIEKEFEIKGKKVIEARLPSLEDFPELQHLGLGENTFREVNKSLH